MGRELYATEQPKLELEKRIQYTFNLYNNAVNVRYFYKKRVYSSKTKTLAIKEKKMMMKILMIFLILQMMILIFDYK